MILPKVIFKKIYKISKLTFNFSKIIFESPKNNLKWILNWIEMIKLNGFYLVLYPSLIYISRLTN